MLCNDLYGCHCCVNLMQMPVTTLLPLPPLGLISPEVEQLTHWPFGCQPPGTHQKMCSDHFGAHPGHCRPRDVELHCDYSTPQLFQRPAEQSQGQLRSASAVRLLDLV